MGLFSNFGKKKETETGNSSVNLNLSKEEKVLQLNLRKDKIMNLCLEKRELNGLTARVALVLDYSGSMSALYRNGYVQQVVEKLLPLAMQFDDNGEMESWIFENSFKRLPEINLNNFDTYVQKEIIDKGYSMGGTNYAPVMKDIANKYLKEDSSSLPTLVLFITDGDNFDKEEATKVIQELSGNNIFWQFVGIGDARFEFLKTLDDLGGRVIDNANFFELNDFRTIPEDTLYQKLLGEYPDWIAEAKRVSILGS